MTTDGRFSSYIVVVYVFVSGGLSRHVPHISAVFFISLDDRRDETRSERLSRRKRARDACSRA